MHAKMDLKLYEFHTHHRALTILNRLREGEGS